MAFLIAKCTDGDVRKTFTNDVASKIRGKYFRPIRAYSDEQTNLNVIYKALKAIETKDKPWIVLPNLPQLTHEDGTFRRTKEMLQNVPRSWIQLDLDWRVEGMNFNAMSLDERVDFALGELPFLSCRQTSSVASNGMVAHLSNKAGIDRYSEYIALRLYVTLSEPLDAKALRKLFSPWHGTNKRGTVDCSLASFNAVHLVRPPKLVNTTREVSETLKLYEGSPLDVNVLRNHPDAKKHQQEVKTFNAGCINDVLDEDFQQELLDLAEQGFFEGNRNYQHFRLISAAIYTKQTAKPIISFIHENKSILGTNRTIKDLEEQERIAHEHNIEELLPNLWNQTDVYKYEPLNVEDLKQADLSPVLERMAEHNQSVIVAKCPHGSGKTMALVPKIEEYIKERYGLPTIRTLYICSLRSVIKQATNSLRMACYITEDGKIDEIAIDTEDRLGICIKSLQRVSGNEHYDLVIVDESEHVGLWADWDNSNHNRLIDVCRQAKVTLFMDADAGDLTMSMARMVSEDGRRDLSVLFNEKSYIRKQTAHLLQHEIDFYGKTEDLLNEGKRIWINVDFADKDTNPRITALVNLINEQFGEGTAIGYDADNRKAPAAFFSNPDEFIEEQFKKGVRAVITSPVVSVGWRYKGMPRFDATVSNYSLGIQSAPAIVQQLERCVDVNNHYLYISPNCVYQDLDKLEEIYYQEYFGNNESEIRAKISFTEDYRDKLKILAKKRSTLEQNNIRLHFYYLWQSYGGSIIELPSVYTDDVNALEALKEYKDLKKTELERRAKEIYSNPDTREAFFWNFMCRGASNSYQTMGGSERDYPPFEDFLKMMKVEERQRVNQEEITELLHLLTSKPDEHAKWTFYSPYWLNDPGRSDNKRNERFYVPIGELIQRIMRVVLDDETLNPNTIREKLLGTEKIILKKSQITDNPKIKEIKNRFHETFKSRLSYYRKNGSTDTLVKKILNELLDFEVKTHQGEIAHENRYSPYSLDRIKQLLVFEMMENGVLPKSKNPRTTKNTPKIQEVISNKIAEEKELSELEIAYLEKSDYLIVAERKSYIPKVLHNLIEATTRQALLEGTTESA